MDVYTLKSIVSAKACDQNHTWPEIGKAVGYSQHTIRVAFYKRADEVKAGPCPICYSRHNGPGTTFEVSGNYAVAESTDGRIRTLPDLLAACKVDLSVWKVRDRDGWEAKAWEGYAADEFKDLTFDEGRITGVVRRDGIITETLWSVRAVLVRREPIPIKPVIQPVQCDASCRALTNNTRAMADGLAMLLADPHYGYSWRPPSWQLIPFHDRAVLDLFLQVASEVQPDVIELLGDWFDMAMFQDKFVQRPEYYHTTQPAILEAHWWLRQLRQACPDTVIRLHMGNHDERIETATINHLREACELRPADEVELPPLMSAPRLLALHELGIEWIGGYPDDITWLGEAVQCQHGSIARKKELATVSELLQQGESCHQVCGHIHRDEMVSHLLESPRRELRTVTAYCPGCACHVDGRVPGVRSRRKWRQGFGLVSWHEKHASFEHVPIWDGKAVCRGNVYTARDAIPMLKEDLAEWPW